MTKKKQPKQPQPYDRSAPRVEDPRVCRLQLRVTPAEKAALQLAAKKAGVTMSAFILDRCLNVSKPR